MPWLTIIITLLSFFASKKSGASNAKAAAIAGLAGAGTYYTTHETTWGRDNLGALDGIDLTKGQTKPTEVPNGSTGATSPVVKDSSGNVITSSTGVMDLLKSWGASGTATVLGTGAAAAGGFFNNKFLLYGGLAVVGIILLN